MSVYNKLSNFRFEHLVFDSGSDNVYFTHSEEIFYEFYSLIKFSKHKVVGYHAFDLRGSEKIKISINRIDVFKQLTRLSTCEDLAKHIYHNSEEIEKTIITEREHAPIIRESNSMKLKVELEVFCSNYHPFDFYKFYERRTENKISFSCLKSGVIERETFNVGNMTLFLIDNNSSIELKDKKGTNKRIDRKYDENYSNWFEYKGKQIIFEFSGKSHYKSLFEMLGY